MEPIRQSRKSTRFVTKRFWKMAAIFLGFLFVFLIVEITAPFIHALMEHVLSMTLTSELTLGEQMSKYCLFIVILISIHSYGSSNEAGRAAMSICYLLLGLVIFLSESNMIKESVQPMFGLAGFGYAFLLLRRSRCWLVLSVLLLGAFFMSSGFLLDFLVDHVFMKSNQVEAIRVAYIFEERADLAGELALCASATIYFIDYIEEFLKSNYRGTLFFLASSGFLTVGTGFMHFHNRLDIKYQCLAMSMMIVGFIGLLVTNRYICRTDVKLTLITEEYFYLFVFFFFVVLPVVCGPTNAVKSLVVWLPVMTFLAVRLHSQHQAKHK